MDGSSGVSITLKARLRIGLAFLVSAHPQMALLRDFSVGRRDLNPQNSLLFLWFKSDARFACPATAGNSRKIPHLWTGTD